jgi:hypothetical protein
MWERRGSAEIELLRRYGRQRVGARAVVPFVLQFKGVANIKGEDVGQYELVATLQIADDPRRSMSYAPIGWRLGKRNSFKILHRGQRVNFEGDVFDYALVRVTQTIEERDTRSGHQRFRVCRIEWQDPVPEQESSGT